MYFRLLKKSDYVPYMVLVNEFRETKLSYEEYTHILNKINAIGEIWLLEEDGKNIIGTGTIIYEQKFIHNGGIVAHLEDIIIKKEFTGKGYGKSFLEHLTKCSKKYGCYKTILYCDKNTQEFYEKCGFCKKNIGMEIRF